MLISILFSVIMLIVMILMFTTIHKKQDIQIVLSYVGIHINESFMSRGYPESVARFYGYKRYYAVFETKNKEKIYISLSRFVNYDVSSNNIAIGNLIFQKDNYVSIPAVFCSDKTIFDDKFKKEKTYIEIPALNHTIYQYDVYDFDIPVVLDFD